MSGNGKGKILSTALLTPNLPQLPPDRPRVEHKLAVVVGVRVKADAPLLAPEVHVFVGAHDVH